MNAPTQNSIVTTQISQMADLLGLGNVDPIELKNTLIATAFNNGDKEISDAQMASLLIVAGQYKLNPWTKEIYAFPDKNKGIIPVVGVCLVVDLTKCEKRYGMNLILIINYGISLPTV